MKENNSLGVLVLSFFIMITTFSMAFFYKILSNFSSSEIYTLTQCKKDVKFSLVIMIAITIVQIPIYFSFLKRKNS